MKPGPKRRIRIDLTTGCHVPMKKARCASGYPQYKHGGRHMQAARVVWIEAHGEIPVGLQVDHLCRNRECVNVAHLELVTPAENKRRSPATKLTLERAREIRASLEPGRTLARRFGVSEATVSLVRSSQVWRESILKSQGRA